MDVPDNVRLSPQFWELFGATYREFDAIGLLSDDHEAVNKEQWQLFITAICTKLQAETPHIPLDIVEATVNTLLARELPDMIEIIDQIIQKLEARNN